MHVQPLYFHHNALVPVAFCALSVVDSPKRAVHSSVGRYHNKEDQNSSSKSLAIISPSTADNRPQMFLFAIVVATFLTRIHGYAPSSTSLRFSPRCSSKLSPRGPMTNQQPSPARTHSTLSRTSFMPTFMSMYPMQYPPNGALQPSFPASSTATTTTASGMNNPAEDFQFLKAFEDRVNRLAAEVCIPWACCCSCFTVPLSNDPTVLSVMFLT